MVDYPQEHLKKICNSLVGSKLTDCIFEKSMWWLKFDDFIINGDGLWRLRDSNGVYTTSEDHGYSFGLGYPLDVKAEIEGQLNNYEIVQVDYNQVTGDLTIGFEHSLFPEKTSKTIEVLTLSAAYECWTLSKIGDKTEPELIGQSGTQIDNPIHKQLLIQDN